MRYRNEVVRTSLCVKANHLSPEQLTDCLSDLDPDEEVVYALESDTEEEANIAHNALKAAVGAYEFDDGIAIQYCRIICIDDETLENDFASESVLMCWMPEYERSSTWENN